MCFWPTWSNTSTLHSSFSSVLASSRIDAQVIPILLLVRCPSTHHFVPAVRRPTERNETVASGGASLWRSIVGIGLSVKDMSLDKDLAAECNTRVSCVAYICSVV